MGKLELVHHEQTNTYWSNDVNWKERWKTESISYGQVTIDTDNIFELKTKMNGMGYELVKDTSGTPFKSKYNC